MPRIDALDREVNERFEAYTVDRKSDSNNGRHYVIQKESKTYHLKLVKNQYLKQNEESEISLLSSVQSDYVVELLDSGSINEEWSYLLFPHIMGRTLDALATDEGWDDQQLRSLAHDVIRGLEDLKVANVVHRDIKPKNIMYDNVNRRYVILDLGIGCYAQKPTKDNTKVPRGVGARFYTAPEQFMIATGHSYNATQLTDQFSLGVVMYELAMAKHPHIQHSATENQDYASLLFHVVPEVIPSTTGIQENIRNAILKMLAHEPSKRFQSNTAVLSSFGLGAADDSISRSRLYLKMPREAKDEMVNYVIENSSKIAGVILTPNDKQEYASKLADEGVKVLLDTSTYKLQTLKEQKVLSSKLNLPYIEQHNMITLYKLRDELLMGVRELAESMNSDEVVLPYFRVDGDEPLIITKEIWKEARSFYESKSLPPRPLLGGIIIPKNTIINEHDRAKLMSRIAGSYDIDGLIVTFENSTSSISTITDQQYASGCKEIIDFLESQFDNLIITRTDLSSIALSHHSSYVGGWPKSFRHFQATQTGGGGGNTTYKMKYFAPKLFTFIEEKSTIQTIVLTGKSMHLECSCSSCAANNPLASTYKEDEIQERTHYFNGLISLYQDIENASRIHKRSYMLELLNTSQAAAIDIKSSGVIGNETIPSYVSLIAAVDS